MVGSVAGKGLPGLAEFQPRTDRVTFEVLRHRLWQINDEQGRTLINVSGSPVVSEVSDFNVALTDADANLVMLGPYLIHHTGAISVVIQNAIAMLRDEVQEGDIYLTNDPWMGALHHNDVCCVTPVHWEGKLVAWAACTVHEVDVGGPAPGSWNLKAENTFQEAPRYRFLRVVQRGKVAPEVVETYLTNSRTPHLLELDLRAIIASSNVVKERLAVVFQRYGPQTVLDVMQDCLDYSTVLLRRRLAEIPDGEWYAEDYFDHNGLEERVHAIRLRLSKKGDELTFDFRETDDQAPGFINCTYAGALAGTLSPVFTQLCTGIPWNHGIIRCLKLLTREGTINNATFPAPVSMGTISGCTHTHTVVSAAVAKMLACSETLRHNLMANWAGSAYVYNTFGQNQYGKPFGIMLVDSHLGAAGARYFADGYDTSGCLPVPRPSVPNVESVESLYPLLYLYRRRAVDSGGPGKFRGGVSGESAMTLHGVDQINITVSTIGSDHSGSVGTAGGYPGGGANAIHIHNSDVWDLLRQGRLPPDPKQWGGEYQALPPKHALVLRPNDVFMTIPHAGGGFGDPLDRDPVAVQQDVVHGFVSLGRAKATYGVVLEPTTSEVDAAATEQQRGGIRAERLQHRPAIYRPPTRTLDPDRPSQRLGEHLRRQDGLAFCAYCRGALGPAAGNPLERCLIIDSDLGKANPWIAIRWQGKSEKFHLIEFVCPHCGSQINVHQRRRDESGVWNDVVIY